jgi:cytochrome P450
VTISVAETLYGLTVWLVAHLVHKPDILKQIREEAIPTVQGKQVDETYLLEQCPKLDSRVSETLRLMVTSSLARMIRKPMLVGGKILKAGNKIMVRLSIEPYVLLICPR